MSSSNTPPHDLKQHDATLTRDKTLPVESHTVGNQAVTVQTAGAVAESTSVATLQRPASPQDGSGSYALAPPSLSHAGNQHFPLDFGGYQILARVAQGGMGVVYRAIDRKLDRVVALKMIRDRYLASDESVRRFLVEARAAAHLDHPGIVPIYEIGEHDGQHYFTMAFVEGGSLYDRIQKEPLPVREAAQLVSQVADAVEYAHHQRVVHRDLKPHNILMDAQGMPKVTDFGLAKRLEETEGFTATGEILGTPGYMPPEQASGGGQGITHLVDVYALGAVLYAATVGRPPFAAATVAETLKQVFEKPAVSPRLLNPSVPKDIETICLKCLEKDPARRYASAGELAEDLRRFLRNEPIAAKPISSTARAWRWCQRNPVVASLVSLAALLVCGVAAVSSAAYLREAHLNAVVVAQKQKAEGSEQRAKKNESAALVAKKKADDEAARAAAAEQRATQQREKAESEATIARTAEQEANLQRENAERERRAARQAAYLHQIGLAKRGRSSR
jgi:serine/threonine protein kinase